MKSPCAKDGHGGPHEMPLTKLQRMADLIAKESEERCESGFGNGYPDDVAIVGDFIVIAGLDDAKDCAPELRVYTKQFAEAWYDLTMKLKKDEPGEDLSF